MLIDALMFKHISEENTFRPTNCQDSLGFGRCKSRAASFFFLVPKQIEATLTPIRYGKFHRYFESCKGDFPADHRFLLKRYVASYLRKNKTRRKAALLTMVHNLLHFNQCKEYQCIHEEVCQAIIESHANVNFLEQRIDMPFPDEVIW